MSPQDIKIAGVTITYNSAERIPYVMPYYERMGIDKLVVYDNESTDGTVEMLKKYPFVEVRTFHTEKYDENMLLKFKTETQKEFKGEYNWFIACDFDEVLYSERDFREVLHDKMCEGKTYFQKPGLNVYSRTFPPIIEGKLVHEIVGKGALWTSDDGVIGIYGNKVILFDLNKVSVIYDTAGCHRCRMEGEKASFDDEIGMFHLKFLDFNFIDGANRMYLGRMKGPSAQCYDYFSKNLEDVFQLMENRSISVSEYLNLPTKELVPPQIVFIVNECDEERWKMYMDEVKKHSDEGILRQYAILFYGYFSGKSADRCFEQGLLDKFFTLYHESTSSPKEAALGFEYKLLGNAVIDNPWMAEVTFEQLTSSQFYRDIEKVLSVKNKTGDNAVVIDSVPFKRYVSYISDTTLGCYMIVKNEERTIKSCLSSILGICDEIVVVDTGCSDKTMEKIAEIGSDKIKTYNFEWVNDFSAARNFAMSKIESDYSFTTDADEVFTPELIRFVSHLKCYNFLKKDSFDIWLLNYNGTDDPDYYLGGRQIVKNYKENVWKYKIHEKLYFKRDDFDVLDRYEGFILHKHVNGEKSKSNYNKYAEIYLNDLNGNLEDVVSYENGAHYFYYLFMTLKNLDIFTAKMFLIEAYDKNRMLSFSEDQRSALYRDFFISAEELLAYSLIKNDVSPEYVANIVEGLKEPFAKYLLLRYVYAFNKDILGESGWLDLSYLSYSFGLIKDFVSISGEALERYPYNETISHNITLANNFINAMKSKTLIIDCREGTNGLASNLFFFSHIFDDIKIRCNRETSLKFFNLSNARVVYCDVNGLVVNGNNQMSGSLALQIFEDYITKKK